MTLGATEWKEPRRVGRLLEKVFSSGWAKGGPTSVFTPPPMVYSRPPRGLVCRGEGGLTVGGGEHRPAGWSSAPSSGLRPGPEAP